ncbi:MAG TPA: diguanylate cyclase [Gemmatimonadales bacterium]|nr:diguanylate cyclase [Gemmatimonadales bacterium]
MIFSIDPERCVACLACVRVCPSDAVAVEDRLVRIVAEACTGCGLCVPACPHAAVRAPGDRDLAGAIADRGDGILILGVECAAHFFPATPDQLVNACYEAGFRTVHRGVIGDELVAAAYLRLWREQAWDTLVRSTDPIVVETVRGQYPELLPYLAPVVTPPVAEARYLRAKYGSSRPIVYAGVAPPPGAGELDAAITFSDLEAILVERGVSVLTQPDYFVRVPEERRRHLSVPGGMPLAILEEARYSSRRFRVVRGLDGLRALARAVAVDRIPLGFVDVLAHDGGLGHPLLGPREELFWRRAVVGSTEPPRSPTPVVDPEVAVDVGTSFAPRPRPEVPSAAVAEILKAVGTGPNGRPWDCGACGFPSCRRFAEAAALGRATLRQCTPYQERRAEEAQQAAAVDVLTGLATFRVLRDRLAFEIERCKRSGERFAVLFIDLDHFKQVNDEFGHEAGNEVLRHVAAEVRKAVRASDLAARYGGDEFVVILTRTDAAGASRVAEALRAGIEGVGRRLGYRVGLVTASVGVAEYDPEHPGEGDLLVTADRALYQAKMAGRNAVA